MAQCHQASITHLKTFLAGIPSLNMNRALEVAAGDGQLTADLLGGLYKDVDCFDQCGVAVAKLEELRQRVAAVDLVDQASMQSYEWQRVYTSVYLRWCVGYLEDQELVDFLRKAKSFLSSPTKLGLRSKVPSAFIFVLDNVLEEDEESYVSKGQRLRKVTDLE